MSGVRDGPVTDYSWRERRLQTAEQAAHWLMMLQSSDMSLSDRAEFVEWLRESPSHVTELLHACELRRRLTRFRWGDAIRTADAGGVIDLRPPASRGRSTSQRIRGLFGQARFRPLAMGASACILVAGIASLLVASYFTGNVFGTAQGERREVTLADGSVVNLSPSTQVSVRLQPGRRLIGLEHGEARFLVAKDITRPFIVTAGNTQVLAVGTIFDVQRRSSGVAVTVVEGRVRVARVASRRMSDLLQQASHSTQTPESLSLIAGQQVVIPAAGSLPAIMPVRSATELAWVTDQLNFDNELVSEIAARFNYHNRTQIVISDAALAGRRISGSFRINDPQSFVAFLRSITGLTEKQPRPDLITLGPLTGSAMAHPPAAADQASNVQPAH